MEQMPKQRIPQRAYFLFTLFLCGLVAGLIAFLAVGHGSNDFLSFSEPVLTLSDGWTIAGGAGHARPLRLPETVSCSPDGTYTLSRVLPEVAGPLSSPAFRFYSNYVDVAVSLDGEALYAFPPSPAAFSGATGNTYHFVRLPTDYAGKTITVALRCQLGSDIPYLLSPPLMGSKATMLSRDGLSRHALRHRQPQRL